MWHSHSAYVSASLGLLKFNSCIQSFKLCRSSGRFYLAHQISQTSSHHKQKHSFRYGFHFILCFGKRHFNDVGARFGATVLLCYGFRSFFSSKSKFNYWMRVTRNLIEVQNFPSEAYVSSMKWVRYSLQSNFLRKTSNGFLINETPLHIAREKREEKKRNSSSMFDTVGYHNGRFDNISTGMLNPW